MEPKRPGQLRTLFRATVGMVASLVLSFALRALLPSEVDTVLILIVVLAGWIVIAFGDDLRTRTIPAKHVAIGVLGAVVMFTVFYCIQRVRGTPARVTTKNDHNKYVCDHAIRPLFGVGTYALLIEFGVHREPTRDFHAQITLSAEFLEARQWWGDPHRTDFHGVEFHSGNGIEIKHEISNVYDVTGCRRPVTPNESVYVYFAGDKPLEKLRVTFAEDMTDAAHISGMEPIYDGCPQ